MLLARNRICAAGLTIIAIGCVVVHPVSAGDVNRKDNAQAPIEMQSHLGSYLAGGLARSLNDTSQAVEFYRHAIQSAANEPRIIVRTFLVEASEGNIAAADKIAHQVVAIEPEDGIAQLWLGVKEFRNRRYKAAELHFQRASSDPLGELTAQLARAWVALVRKRPTQALNLLSRSNERTWSSYYVSYHRALVADLASLPQTAQEAYNDAFKASSRTPRSTAAYIHHAINRGKYILAGRIARQHIRSSANGGHPSIVALYDDIKAGSRAELLVKSPQDGLAEVFYGLGDALIDEGGVDLGILYLRMALALKPDFPLAIIALAGTYEATQNYQTALALYDSIRGETALDMEIAISKAMNIDAMGETDKARQILDDIIASHPRDIRPLEAIGNILRNRKRYREAIDYYSRIIKLLPKSESRHWVYWYARGTSYERIKQWTNAEKDLLKAMELNPNQALILNYLGYSWVDQNVHLHRGLELIEKAVSLKPDDGYIVDSLGWAHYRIGNFDKAVKYLERAVELRPEDPVLNDHLGDALWRVNRRQEARHQWKFALTMKPETEEAAKIRKKLIHGLPSQPSLKAVSEKEKHKVLPAKIGKRADNNADVPSMR